MAEKQVVTRPGGTIGSSTTTGNVGASGRSINSPTTKTWKVQTLVADLVATATVGNRVLLARIYNTAGAIVWVGSASASITAGQTGGYDIGFGSPINTPSTTVRRNLANTGNVNVMVRESCSLTDWGANWYVTIEDLADIDVADQLTMRISYTEYEA